MDSGGSLECEFSLFFHVFQKLSFRFSLSQHVCFRFLENRQSIVVLIPSSVAVYGASVDSKKKS